MRREGVGLRFQLVPFPGRLGIGEVAHHLHDVRAVVAVKLQRGSGVLFGRLQPEMVPEGERWTVELFSRERALHPLGLPKRALSSAGQHGGCRQYEYSSKHRISFLNLDSV